MANPCLSESREHGDLFAADDTLTPADGGLKLSWIPAPGSRWPVSSDDLLADGRAVTVVRTTHGQHVGKRFSLDSAGNVQKTTAANFSEFRAATVPVADLDALGAVIAGLRADEYIILGALHGAGFEPYRLNSESWFERRKPGGGRPAGIVDIGDGIRRAGRFKENFQTCRYALIDRDFNPAMPEALHTDDAGFAQQMEAVWPGFALAGKLIIGSSSNRVLRDGQPINRSPSQHIYVELGDGWQDWDALRTRLDARCINAGFGFITYSKADAVLRRAIFDVSVLTAGRQVYEGAPAVGPGLTLSAPQLQRMAGTVLAFPEPLAMPERETYRRDTGNTITETGRKIAVSNDRALTLETRVETQRNGIMTVAQYQESSLGKLRCQTPFRESTSWNGILNRTTDGRVFVHDNGAGVTYWLASPSPLYAEGLLPVSPEAGAATLRTELTTWLDTTGPVADLAIKGAAGLGKTTVAAELIQARIEALAARTDTGAAATFYVKTVKNALELQARLPVGAAVVIRGRTHGLKLAAGDVVMDPPCRKAEAAQLLIDNGSGGWQQRLLCGKQRKDGSWQCPHSADCEYHAQFKTGAPIELRAHNWLVLGSNEDHDHAPVSALAVVDEDPSAVFEEKRQWTLAQCAEAGGLFLEVAQAIRDGTLNYAEHFERIKAELAMQPAVDRPPIHGGMEADEARRAMGRWLDKRRDAGPREPWGLLRRAMEVVQTGEAQRLYAHTQDGNTKIYYAGLKRLAARAQRFLFLDASLNIDIVRMIRPALALDGLLLRPDVRLVEIHVRRNGRFIQITDTALSAGRLDANAAHLDQRIGELLRRLAAENPAGALTGPKEFLAHLTGNGLVPRGIPTAHYGALRGLNALEHADWAVQLGRHELPWWEVQRRARCWFSGAPDFNPAPAIRTTTLLTGKTDSAAVTVTAFQDRYCQSLLEMTREQESLQAIDRLRLVHATTTKTILLLSNQPLPGICPDQLVTLNDLLLPGRLAAVMNRDGALVLGRTWLAAHHPDLFPSAEAAHNAIVEFFNGRFPYINLLGKSTIENAWAEVTYRPAGQRGGRARRALLYPSADPVAALTRLHGAAITILDADPPPPRPAPPAILWPQPTGNLSHLYPDGFNAATYPIDPGDWLQGAEADAMVAQLVAIANGHTPAPWARCDSS
jgi:hypothetical protein